MQRVKFVIKFIDTIIQHKRNIPK